jgi:hypothetical protein
MPFAWNTWISSLRRTVRRCLRLGLPDARPTGPAGVIQLGHREYVGGRWDELGKLQFDFLCAHGLRPDHVVLDVACGSLRAGVYLIPYLNANHYWGLEKEPDLVAAGVAHELAPGLQELKQPKFLINSDFDVSAMTVAPDFIWVHSLLTHLPLEMIRTCLTELKSIAGPQTVCYATFFNTPTQRQNPVQAHDHETFFYTLEELTACATSAGWKLKLIGDWGHPRGQQMLELRSSN